MKITTITIAFLLFAGVFAACEKDNDAVPEKPEPTIENIEIGLNNNGIAVIGRDFHFEADIVAGDKIDDVRIKILQKSGETYSKDWSFEIIWDEYKGAKNANVHKHFDIPEDAAEGIYDFVITIHDENGTTLEDVQTISIYLPENLPVDPQLSIFSISKSGSEGSGFFYRNGEFIDGNLFSASQVLSSQATISGVKGDGKMYILLINKALNHRPETIDDIDFSKAVVYDVFEHQNEELVYPFSNAVFNAETFTWIRKIPRLTIGAANDNNAPQPNPIDGEKAWETGDYYFGIVYRNTTYNSNFHHYIEFEIIL